jgi:[ribosomal protein S5]-alanine N-acetyltransferase
MELMETQRLILRELRSTDADRIFRYANDESINRYLSFGDLASEDGARKYVKTAIASAATDPDDGPRRHYKLAIILKPEIDFIGSCWLDITDTRHSRASVGYFIDANHWNKGYATEAVKGLIKYGFETLKLHRLEANCDADHQATRRVLEKAGLKREARMRQKRQRLSIWADCCLYAIIESP